MDMYHPPNPNENDPGVGRTQVVKSQQFGRQKIEGREIIPAREIDQVSAPLSPEERRLAYLRNFPRHRRIIVPGDPPIYYKLLDRLDHSDRWLVEVNLEHHVVMSENILWAGPAHQEFRRILGKQCDLYPESIPHGWWFPNVYLSLKDDHDGTKAAERVIGGTYDRAAPDKTYEFDKAEFDRLADELERHEDLAEGRWRFFMKQHGHGCRCGCEGELS
jgi:hypothetical protein